MRTPLALSLLALVAACAASDGGPGDADPYALVITGSSQDFLICRDTTGSLKGTDTLPVGWVGDREDNDTTFLGFLAGQCASVLLFPYPPRVDSIPEGATIDSAVIAFTLVQGTGTVPPGDLLLGIVGWNGDQEEAGLDFELVDPITFTPSAGRHRFNVWTNPNHRPQNFLQLSPYRLQLATPTTLNGVANQWHVVTGEGAAAARPTLTYHWTPPGAP
jgi:hypothetical protein